MSKYGLYLILFLNAFILVISCISDCMAEKRQATQKDEVRFTVEECKRTQDEKIMIMCIEQGVYDPCDSGGGIHSWIMSQCAWAHAEIADKKIKKAEKEIIRRLRNGKFISSLEKFQTAQQKWRESTDYYCRFVNEADEAGVFEANSYYLAYGFCLRRHNEQRAKELEAYIKK